MGEENINITYETLFEILKNEKNREDLQKLSTSFLSDVASYLTEKQDLFENSQSNLEMFSDEEREKSMLQIQNFKRKLKELYNYRERKIVFMALSKARTNSNIMDTSSLLGHEKALFNELVNLLTDTRSSILNKFFERRVNTTSNQKQEVNSSNKDEDKDDEDEEQEEKTVATKVIRFLTSVPKFMGKELEVYGPFDEEDVASLPVDVAELLVKKGRAEELSQD